MIKYAVMTFMYNNWVNSEEGSHEKLIQILGESESEGIEAFANHFMGNDGLVQLYQKEMASNAIKMPVMDLIANLACADKRLRGDAYDTMRKGIDICDALDAEIVHVAGYCLPEGVSRPDGQRLIVEGLMEFTDDVNKRGMTLAFENFDPSPKLICAADDCLDILNQTEGKVKFVFDTGNFEAATEQAEDNFDKMFEHTCHFHFKDFERDDTQKGYHGTYFGKGKINNRKIAELIKKSNSGILT